MVTVAARGVWVDSAVAGSVAVAGGMDGMLVLAPIVAVGATGSVARGNGVGAIVGASDAEFVVSQAVHSSSASSNTHSRPKAGGSPRRGRMIKRSRLALSGMILIRTCTVLSIPSNRRAFKRPCYSYPHAG